jgi:hypothetical protein
MRLVSLIIGALFLLIGLRWIGQGTGYFPWPRNPVMDNQIAWAYYGGIVVAIGLIIIWFPRRQNI